MYNEPCHYQVAGFFFSTHTCSTIVCLSGKEASPILAKGTPPFEREQGSTMKILHTSDWHIGRTLYGKKRYEEFEAFLQWLVETIQMQKVDILLVCGDVFDTGNPSNRAQELYYRFLCDVANTCCRHVIVIAGNHDSPSFLDAPKALLRTLHVQVIGSTPLKKEEEVLVLYNREEIEAIICAVPYLHDKDIRTAEAGETIDDKNAKLVEGLKKHYEEVCSIAEQKRRGRPDIPIIAMGHLFTAGGKTVEGDGVRELYVGSLTHIELDVFPSCIDYLALGHLHIQQYVGNQMNRCYSGSPIPMGFGEANQEKRVMLLEFNDAKPTILELSVPCFQQLVRIVGPLETIQAKLNALQEEHSQAWLEIEYTGKDLIPNLRELLDESLLDSTMEIRRIKNKQVMDRVLNNLSKEETLDELSEQDVFIRCLDAYKVPEEERKELVASYTEIVQALQEDDANAE